MMTLQELENRLIDFAVTVIGVVEALPGTKAGNPIAGQLIHLREKHENCGWRCLILCKSKINNRHSTIVNKSSS